MDQRTTYASSMAALTVKTDRFQNNTQLINYYCSMPIFPRIRVSFLPRVLVFVVVGAIVIVSRPKHVVLYVHRTVRSTSNVYNYSLCVCRS